MEILEKAQESSDNMGTYYFHKKTDHIRLNNNQVVCVTKRWGTRGINKNRWDTLKEHMKQYRYSIAQYRLVNIEDREHRLWKYCRRFKFVSAGGKSGAAIEKLQQGDLLFIFRVGDNVDKKLKGCVACGRVTSANAVDVWDIPTPNGKLKDEKFEDGQTYYDKFSDNDTNTDKAVSVKWILPFRDDEPIRITGNHRMTCVSKINSSDFKNLTSAFNIHSANTEE